MVRILVYRVIIGDLILYEAADTPPTLNMEKVNRPFVVTYNLSFQRYKTDTIVPDPLKRAIGFCYNEAVPNFWLVG